LAGLLFIFALSDCSKHQGSGELARVKPCRLPGIDEKLLCGQLTVSQSAFDRRPHPDGQGSALPNPLEVSRLSIARIVHPGLIASREREPKGASFSGFALNADLSLMRFHSKPAKGEPQASRMPMLAATVSLSKFFKDVFVLIARYPLAVVADRNGDISPRALNIYPDCSI
jgi:hypothetical protein